MTHALFPNKNTPFKHPQKKRKVICLGWQKTGTSSLTRAFGILGYKSNKAVVLTDHLYDGIVSVNHVLDFIAENDFVADFPFPLLYRQIEERFPDSLFILTTRDPDAWLVSMQKHIEASPATHIDNRVYGFDVSGVSANQDKAQKALDRYLDHNADVIGHFKGKDSLLVCDVIENPDWADICAFVGEPIPDRKFPWLNRAKADQGDTVRVAAKMGKKRKKKGPLKRLLRWLKRRAR